MALLHALLELRPIGDTQLPLLTIAHLNHLLRGDESDADEDFVRSSCKELLAKGYGRLSFRSEKVETARFAAEQHANLEDLARRFRYDWLVKVALEAGSTLVMTGHSADDQAETVLHRLLRGTGIKGLRGIAKRRQLREGVALVRPLLGVRRKDILAYLDLKQIAFRQDSSNADPRFTRNRIRHGLLPLLEREYNPRIATLLAELAVQADGAFQILANAMAQLSTSIELDKAGRSVVLDRTRLKGESRPAIRELMRYLWAREGWPMGRMGFREWDRLAGLALGEADAIDLPHGIRAQARERVVLFGPCS